MEVTLFIIALVVLQTSLIVLIGIVYLIYRTAMTQGLVPDVSFSRILPSRPGKDEYTPTDADPSVPLDQFTPDFSKPLTYTIRDEDDQTIMEEVPADK